MPIVHQEVYDNTIEMNQLSIMKKTLLIFLLITLLVFHSTEKKTGQVRNGGKKDVEIMVPLKNPSNFWRTLEITLINCKISLQTVWFKTFFLVATTLANQVPNNLYKTLCFHCKFINSRQCNTA